MGKEIKTEIIMGSGWLVKGNAKPMPTFSLEKGKQAELVGPGQEIVVFSSQGTQVRPGGVKAFDEVGGKVVDHVQSVALYSNGSYVQKGEEGQPNFLKITHTVTQTE